jgi:NADPH:quinone reductase-like Zn-dependent oxidoreductase
MARRDVWRIDQAGSLNRLTRRAEDLPTPAPGEAQVVVKAIGLNFADIFACLGLYSATPTGSFIPGLEFAGVVEAVGPRASESGDTHGIRPGDPVVGLTRFGGYATAVNASLQLLRPVRPGWDLAEAVALPAQGVTAWYGLVTLGAVASGDVVLLHSAAGGVGLNALAILGAVGARTVATVGHESKRQWLVEQRGLSKHQVVVRDPRTFGRDLDGALASLGATGFDVVFDAVSGPCFTPGYERLNAEGRLVVYGAADFMSRGARPNVLRLAMRYLRRPRLDPLQMISANRSVMAFNLIWLWDRLDRLAAGYDALDVLIAEPPLVGRRFPFADAHAAMRYLQSGQSVGKVVLEVDQ